MFDHILSKLIPRKKTVLPLTGRDLDGRNNVGYPTMQLAEAIDNQVDNYYRDIKPLIKFYKETFLFKWGPAIINNSLSDEQLSHLSAQNVQLVYLLLFRDMLRHVAVYVTPKRATANWPDLFAQAVLDSCRILNDNVKQDDAAKQRLLAVTEPYAIESEEAQPWAESIAALIAVPVADLYYWHRALTNTILKKVSKKKRP